MSYSVPSMGGGSLGETRVVTPASPGATDANRALTNLVVDIALLDIGIGEFLLLAEMASFLKAAFTATGLASAIVKTEGDIIGMGTEAADAIRSVGDALTPGGAAAVVIGGSIFGSRFAFNFAGLGSSAQAGVGMVVSGERLGLQQAIELGEGAREIDELERLKKEIERYQHELTVESTSNSVGRDRIDKPGGLGPDKPSIKPSKGGENDDD